MDQMTHAMPKEPSLDDQIRAELAGGDVPADEAKINAELQAESIQRKQEVVLANQKLASDIQNMQAINNVVDVVAGAHTGMRSIVRNTFNGVVGAVDALENYAASKGIGSGDLIGPQDRWEDKKGKHEEDELGTPGKIANAFTQVAVPLATGYYAGGAVAGIAVDTAYNFLATNPVDKNLPDLLKGTFVDDLPGVYEALETVRHKPDDTEMDMRVKNAVAAMGFSAAVTGLVGGVSKLAKVRAGQKVLENPTVFKEVEQETAKMSQAIVDANKPKPQFPITQAVDGVPAVKPVEPPVVGTPAEEKALAAFEANGYKSSDTPAQFEEFKQYWQSAQLDAPPISAVNPEVPHINLQNEGFLETLYNISKNTPEGVLRKPMSDYELRKAAEALAQDPQRMQTILDFKPGAVLNDVDTLLTRYALHNTETEWQAYLKSLPENLSTADRDLLARKTEGYMRMSDIIQGNASNKGAGLRAEQVAGYIFGTSPKDGMALMGAQGRAILSKAWHQRFGGTDAIDNYAKGLKIIADLPDSQFKYFMGEVVRKSKLERIDDAVTKVALNGMTMLSGKGAAVANTIAANKLILDKYLEAALPWSKTSFSEANALAHGMYSSIQDGIAAGWTAAKESRDIVTKNQRLDLVAGTVKLSNQADLAIQSGLVPWSEKGVILSEKAADILSLGGAPTRVLVGVDAAYNHTITQGYLRSFAVRAAEEAGVQGEAREAFMKAFIARPPADVADQIDEIAKTAVLSNDPAGFIGEGLEGIQNHPWYEAIPARRVIFPFLKTTFNGMVYAADNSPMFAASPNFWNAVKSARNGASGPLETAVAKAMSGSMALAALMYAAHSGDLKGGYAESKATKDVVGDDIAPNTSIKVNGKWVNAANLGYISSLINVASFMNKVSGYVTSEEYDELAKGFMVTAVENITPDNLTDNVAGLLNVVRGKEEALKWLQDLPNRFVPASSGLAAIREQVDERQRITKMNSFYDTMVARFKNRIPGLSDTLPAKRNYFGEAMTPPPGLLESAVSVFSPGDDDDGRGQAIKSVMDNLKMYQELHASDPVPPQSIDFNAPDNKIPLVVSNPDTGITPTGLRYQLEPKEYSAYQAFMGGVDPRNGKPIAQDGKTLKERFHDIMQVAGLIDVPYNKITPVQYERAVTKMKEFVMAHQKAADNLIRGYNGIQEKMDLQGSKAYNFKQQEGLVNVTQ